MDDVDRLLAEVRACTVCADLPERPRNPWFESATVPTWRSRVAEVLG
ncbi:MAG: hypothetical protein ACI867_000365 [Glaciecola sp.]|jgi:hypothetical protein